MEIKDINILLEQIKTNKQCEYEIFYKFNCSIIENHIKYQYNKLIRIDIYEIEDIIQEVNIKLWQIATICKLSFSNIKEYVNFLNGITSSIIQNIEGNISND